MTMISNLFMTESNHIDLARHRVNFVLDQIRNKYLMDISELNQGFVQRLSDKSNVDEATLQQYIDQLNTVRNETYLKRKDFMEFNKNIEQFIKKLDLYHGTNRTRTKS